MKDFEILRVQMDTQPAQEGSSYLEELFARLKEQFAKTGKQFASALAGVGTQAKGMLTTVLKTYKQMANGLDSVTKGSLKRTVAGFDQLNRLAKSTGSAVIKEDRSLMQGFSHLADKLQQAGTKLRENLFEPLTQIPQNGLGSLNDQLRSLLGITEYGTGQVRGMSDAWQQLGLQTDFWKHTVQQTNHATGTFNDLLSASGLRANETAMHLQKLGLSLAGHSMDWDRVSHASQSAWQTVSGVWDRAGQWFSDRVSEPVSGAFTNLFTRVTRDADSAKQTLTGLFSQMGQHVGSTLSQAWGKISDAFSQGGQVQSSVQSGVLEGFKKMGNSLIQGLNAVAVEPFSGLNNMLNKLQQLQIGSLKPFSFLSWRASIPKIPYLAQGAVLPANKPFLAMVGDQRHGTNVEAPLSTIQEAVSLAMEDYMQGNMAGHGATVQALQQILQAVLGISIGDETIAAACDRHHQKMAIMNGR